MVAALGSVALAAHWLVSAVLILLGLTTTYVRRAKLKPHSVGFFHPHTSDGGGGERVPVSYTHLTLPTICSV